MQRILIFFTTLFLFIGNLLGISCPKPSTPTLTPEEQRKALQLLTYQMDENGIFYVEHPRWGENFGFYQIYDLDHPLIQLEYDTVPVEFQYDGKDWLVQLWKGRYGLVMLGGEIGVFNKTAGQAEYHSPLAEEDPIMAMDLYHHNFKSGETEYILARGPQSDWWLNGFVPGSFYENHNTSEMIMVASIQFANEEMLQAFEAAFAAAGFTQGSPACDNPETYSVSGNSLVFSWQCINQGA